MLLVNTHSRLIHSWIYLAVVLGEEGWRAVPLAGHQNEGRKYRNVQVGPLIILCSLLKNFSSWFPTCQFSSGLISSAPYLRGSSWSIWRSVEAHVWVTTGSLKTANVQEQKPKPWSHGNGGQGSGNWEVLGLMEFEIGGIPLAPGRMTNISMGKCPFLQNVLTMSSTDLTFPWCKGSAGKSQSKDHGNSVVTFYRDDQWWAGVSQK